MFKTFDHAVIWDGVLYPANTPIEVKEAKPKADEKPVAKAPKKKSKKGGVEDGE